jgi:Plasmid stabilisation system protein.
LRVIVSEAAALDLEEIGDEIARDNPRRAQSFVGELRAMCLSLRRYPERPSGVAA